MNRIKTLLLLVLLALPGFAVAQVIPSLPYNLTNGTIADANQVMANFNQIVSSTNTNAANAGANTNITALLGLTTPLAPASGGSALYTAGTSGGSANAQTVLTPTPSGYVLAAGRIVIFTAGFTNSGPMTLNVNSTGAIAVVQHSQSGLIPLAGGEVVATQATIAYYDGTQYQLLDASPQGLVSACTEIDYRGVQIPSGYLSENGAAVSRTTYANLFACITRSGQAASTVNGSPTVTVANSALYQVGWYVGGANVTCNSTITAIPGGGVTLTISANAGATGATTLTIGPYPQGDCSTTFTLPDARGRASVMVDSGGGTVLTSTTCTNPNTLGTVCGTETKTLVTSNLPPYTPAGSVSVSTWSVYALNAVGGANSQPSTLSQGNNANSIQQTYPASTGFTGTAQGGTSVPVSSIQPISLVTKAIKF